MYLHHPDEVYTCMHYGGMEEYSCFPIYICFCINVSVYVLQAALAQQKRFESMGRMEEAHAMAQEARRHQVGRLENSLQISKVGKYEPSSRVEREQIMLAARGFNDRTFEKFMGSLAGEPPKGTELSAYPAHIRYKPFKKPRLGNRKINPLKVQAWQRLSRAQQERVLLQVRGVSSDEVVRALVPVIHEGAALAVLARYAHMLYLKVLLGHWHHTAAGAQTKPHTSTTMSAPAATSDSSIAATRITSKGDSDGVSHSGEDGPIGEDMAASGTDHESAEGSMMMRWVRRSLRSIARLVRHQAAAEGGAGGAEARSAARHTRAVVRLVLQEEGQRAQATGCPTPLGPPIVPLPRRRQQRSRRIDVQKLVGVGEVDVDEGHVYKHGLGARRGSAPELSAPVGEAVPLKAGVPPLLVVNQLHKQKQDEDAMASLPPRSSSSSKKRPLAQSAGSHMQSANEDDSSEKGVDDKKDGGGLPFHWEMSREAYQKLGHREKERLLMENAGARTQKIEQCLLNRFVERPQLEEAALKAMIADFPPFWYENIPSIMNDEPRRRRYDIENGVLRSMKIYEKKADMETMKVPAKETFTFRTAASKARSHAPTAAEPMAGAMTKVKSAESIEEDKNYERRVGIALEKAMQEAAKARAIRETAAPPFPRIHHGGPLSRKELMVEERRLHSERREEVLGTACRCEVCFRRQWHKDTTTAFGNPWSEPGVIGLAEKGWLPHAPLCHSCVRSPSDAFSNGVLADELLRRDSCDAQSERPPLRPVFLPPSVDPPSVSLGSPSAPPLWCHLEVEMLAEDLSTVDAPDDVSLAAGVVLELLPDPEEAPPHHEAAHRPDMVYDTGQEEDCVLCSCRACLTTAWRASPGDDAVVCLRAQDGSLRQLRPPEREQPGEQSGEQQSGEKQPGEQQPDDVCPVPGSVFDRMARDWVAEAKEEDPEVERLSLLHHGKEAEVHIATLRERVQLEAELRSIESELLSRMPVVARFSVQSFLVLVYPAYKSAERTL